MKNFFRASLPAALAATSALALSFSGFTAPAFSQSAAPLYTQMALGNPDGANTLDHSKLLEQHPTNSESFNCSLVRGNWFQYTIPPNIKNGGYPFAEVGDMSIPPEVDGGAWKVFNTYLLAQSHAGKTIFVLTGPAMAHGNTSASVWKIALVSAGGRSSGGRLISVLIPTDGTALSDWKQYRVAANIIAAATGFKLFETRSDTDRANLLKTVDTAP